ncbi:OTU domain-containing protein, partial [Skeletonema marinoi]
SSNNNNKAKGGGSNNKSSVSGSEKKAKRGGGGNAKRGGGGKSKSNHSSSTSDDDDTQFRNQLLNQGHLIREMNSDGNCLFRSLSDQLYNDDGEEHGTVRSEICDYLERNKDEFQCFLLMNEDDEDIMNIDDYVEHMREHTTWGSDIEIVAASRKYKRGIKVFSTHYGSGVLRFVNHEDNNEQLLDDSFDLLLSYHGNDHYNSVRLIEAAVQRGKISFTNSKECKK